MHNYHYSTCFVLRGSDGLVNRRLQVGIIFPQVGHQLGPAYEIGPILKMSVNACVVLICFRVLLEMCSLCYTYNNVHLNSPLERLVSISKPAAAATCQCLPIATF